MPELVLFHAAPRGQRNSGPPLLMCPARDGERFIWKVFPRAHNRAGKRKFYLTPVGTCVIKKGQVDGHGMAGDSCTGLGLPSSFLLKDRWNEANGCFPSLATDRKTESFSTRTSIGLRLAGLSACLSGGQASLDEQWMEIGGRDNETTSEGDRERITPLLGLMAVASIIYK